MAAINKTGNTDPQALKVIAIAALVVLLAAIFILASVPPVSRDALTHHLAVPKLYLKHGLGQELPHILYSYFPMNIDLLYMIPLALDFDIGAKYIHLFFGLLTAFIMFRLLRRWLNWYYGLLGALLFLTLPVVMKLSVSAYVDLGLTFFSAAALFSAVKWLENPSRLSDILCAAVFCGLALGTKYNALILFCFMALSIPLAGMVALRRKAIAPETASTRKLNRHLILKAGAVFCLLALLVYSPWAVRNFMWTWNPIYPLYDNFIQELNPGGNDLSTNDRIREAFAKRINRDHFLARRLVFKETPFEIVTIPIRIFFQGRDNDPQYFDGRLSPLLFFLPLLAFAGAKKEVPYIKLAKMYLFTFAWLYILLVFMTADMRVRYIAPALPPLVVLAICGVSNVMEFLDRTLKKRYFTAIAGMAFLLVMLIPGLMYIRVLYDEYTPFKYLNGEFDRPAYIERFWPEFEMLQHANESLPATANVLSIFGGNRRYYSDCNLFFNNEMFQQIIVTNQTAEGIHKDLRRKGFSHLMIHYPLYRKWIIARLNEEQRGRVKAFFRHYTKTLFAVNDHALLRL